MIFLMNIKDFQLFYSLGTVFQGRDSSNKKPGAEATGLLELDIFYLQEDGRVRVIPEDRVTVSGN